MRIKHNKRYLDDKDKRIKKLKRQILVLILPGFVGMYFIVGLGCDYCSRIDWFVPKTITVLNREEVKDSNSYEPDSLVQAGELPYVESGSATSGVISKSPATSIEEKIKEAFGEEYEIARAVMMAESHGNCEAVGDTHLARPSVGLFQISQIYHNYDTETLMNPDENIRIAKEIRTRGGWERWSTYRTGVYKNFL